MSRRRRSLLVGAIAAGVVLVGFVLASQLTGPRETPFVGPPSPNAPAFSDRTIEFGIVVTHRQGDDRLTGLDETLGSGACVLDYDSDGFVDLLMVNGSGDTRYYGQHQWWQTAPGHRLLRNVDGRRFVDATAEAGLEAVTHGLGCVAADFDDDGDPDVLITNVGSNLVLRNDGGSFTDVTAESGLSGDGWQTAAAVADADGDGDLDVYIGGFIAFERGARAYEPGSQFKQDAEAYFNSALFPALPNHLFENVGGMRFVDVTSAAGVDDRDGRTLSALWTDVNEDGRPDLVVANAVGTGSTTGFLNNGRLQFEPLGIQSRIEAGTSFRGAAVGDLDNDGRAELLLTGAAGSQTALLFRGGTGAPVFTDRARQWELASERNAAFSPWSPLLADFNNDGWLDLLVGNGQIQSDTDTAHVTTGQPKQLWLNAGTRLVEQTPSARSPLLDHQSTRGMVYADFNNDGNIDVYVAHNNDLGQLLMNESRQNGHWIGIKLMEQGGNTEAVGARVAVATSQGTLVRWVTKGSGFLSDSDPRLHFGLGSLDRVNVTVRWPDGSKTTYRDVAADRYVTISRSNGLELLDVVASRERASAPLAEDEASRVAYFETLARWHADDARPELRERLLAVLADPSENARAAVVRALAARPSQSSLGVLLRFFDDPSPAVAADAVGAVCAYEDEAVVRFLLRMFAHDDGAVRAAAAACFERYFAGFAQLQAVIHRKYLALPYLVRALDDDDAAVRIASIRALAAAERFRGVPPLIDLLSKSDGAVRSNAIRALGLIRDRYALNALLDLVRREDLPPTAYADTFVALQRLSYERLPTLLDDFAAGRGVFTRVDFGTRMSALLEVVRSPEGIVIPPREILRRAAVVYGAARRDEAAALAYAELLVAAGGEGGVLAGLSQHPSPAVRAAAYRARFALEPASRGSTVAAAINDADLGVRMAVLERASADPVPLPGAAALAALRPERTRLAALRALRTVPSQEVAALLVDWARDTTADPTVRVAAVQLLDRSNQMFAPPEQWYAGASDELLITMLTCETRRLPPIFFSKTPPAFLARYLGASSPSVRAAAYRFLLTREEFWAKQAVVMLLEGDADQELRRSVLHTLPVGYLRDDAVLSRIAAGRDDPLRLDALRLLYGSSTADAAVVLRTIAADSNEDRAARLMASAALPPNERTDLLPSLQ